MTPYLTVVATGRNDNYGGNFLRRMQTFIDCLLLLFRTHQLDAEIIIVEWNPPIDTLLLRDALPWNDMHGTIRIIEVPAAVHKKIPNSDTTPIFEYIAKNTGIRRANGEYVLATNPDLLYSTELVRFIASHQLSEESFYRVDRYDVDTPIPIGADLQQQLAFCEQHVSKVNTRAGAIEPQETLSTRLRRYARKELDRWALRNSRSLRLLHTNASGDFMLMHRDNWLALRAYPEFPTTAYIDGYMCAVAAAAGLRQIILESPIRIYHQEHPRAVDWKNTSASKRPITDYEIFLQHAGEMLRRRKPTLFNDEDWGLGNYQLEEFHHD